MVRGSLLPTHGRGRRAGRGRRLPDLDHHGPLDHGGQRDRLPPHDRDRAAPGSPLGSGRARSGDPPARLTVTNQRPVSYKGRDHVFGSVIVAAPVRAVSSLTGIRGVAAVWVLLFHMYL